MNLTLSQEVSCFVGWNSHHQNDDDWILRAWIFKEIPITRSLQASEFESFVYFMVTPAREHILYHKESFHPERYEVSFHRESHRLGEPSSKIYATLAAKEVGCTFLMTYRC